MNINSIRGGELDFEVAKSVFASSGNFYFKDPIFVRDSRKTYLLNISRHNLFEPSTDINVIMNLCKDVFVSLVKEETGYRAELSKSAVGFGLTAAEALCRAYIILNRSITNEKLDAAI